MVNTTQEYICENSHRVNYPDIDVEAQENSHTKQWEGHFLCKKCGAGLEFDGAKAFSKLEE